MLLQGTVGENLPKVSLSALCQFFLKFYIGTMRSIKTPFRVSKLNLEVMVKVDIGLKSRNLGIYLDLIWWLCNFHLLRLLVLCLVSLTQKAAAFWVDVVIAEMFILLIVVYKMLNVVRSTLDLEGVKLSDISELCGDLKA